MFIWADVRPNSRSGGLSCYGSAKGPYVLSARIINFYVPLIITWSAYIGIIYKMRHSTSKAILRFCLVSSLCKTYAIFILVVGFILALMGCN